METEKTSGSSQSDQSKTESKTKLYIEDIEQTLLMDGFDKALLGFGSQAGQGCLSIYSYDKLVEVCVEDMGMSKEEAFEYIAYNILCTYMGEKTPIILTVGPEKFQELFHGSDTDTENTEASA